MARGWWVPQHPPDWVRYIAQAAGNRAARQLLESPPLPPPASEPVSPEAHVNGASGHELPAGQEPIALPASTLPESPMWRRVTGRIFGRSK
jgi:hypothetical protein